MDLALAFVLWVQSYRQQNEHRLGSRPNLLHLCNLWCKAGGLQTFSCWLPNEMRQREVGQKELNLKDPRHLAWHWLGPHRRWVTQRVTSLALSKQWGLTCIRQSTDSNHDWMVVLNLISEENLKINVGTDWNESTLYYTSYTDVVQYVFKIYKKCMIEYFILTMPKYFMKHC